jgi:hypothetical protein
MPHIVITLAPCRIWVFTGLGRLLRDGGPDTERGEAEPLAVHVLGRAKDSEKEPKRSFRDEATFTTIVSSTWKKYSQMIKNVDLDSLQPFILWFSRKLPIFFPENTDN